MIIKTILLAFIIGITSHDVSAATLSCEGGIVSTGDSIVDLIAKCGEPHFKNSHQDEIIYYNRDIKQKAIIIVEEWTYDLGPQQLMRTVTLKNNEISDIKTGQYGMKRDMKSPEPECSGGIISIDDSKADVFMKCGEPYYKDSRHEETSELIDETMTRKIIVTVDKWTYNFGPKRFLRIVTFKNGKVTDIRTGGYGFPQEKY